MQTTKKIKQDKGRIAIYTVYFVVFVLYSVICLYPLFFCFTNSMKSVEEYYTSMFAMPQHWGITYYIKIFNSFKVGQYGFWNMAFNSFWQSFGGQLLNILASIMVAYPLARYNFPFKKFFYAIIIFRITIPIIGAGPAAYKFFRAINFVNNPLYIITCFAGFDLNALILYGYFKAISKEYSEAAYMDGATRLQTLFTVVLPQAFPCVLALYVNSVMGQWNNYTMPQIYLTNYPNLALGIYEFEKYALFTEGGTPMFFGALILSSIVPLGLFTASQKLLLTNMSVGGIKG